MINYDELIRKEWYAQGFNCTPLLINPCGNSVMFMEPFLGDAINYFLYEFRNDYGKAYYSRAGLDRLGGIIIDRIKSDDKFLEKSKEMYESEFEESTADLKLLREKDLSVLSVNELVGYLKKAVDALAGSVARSHMIEPFALSTDIKIRDMLSKYIEDNKELNTCLSILSTPSEKSFVNESEEELFEISKITDDNERKKRVKEYIKKFFWIKNSYCGRVVLTEEVIEKDLKLLKKPKPFDREGILKKQKELLTSLGLDDDLVMLLKASNFITTWQDSRKINILNAIDYLEIILEELSRRISVDVKLLRYLSPVTEINGETFANPDLKKILEERMKGVVFLYHKNEELILVGDDYIKFHKDIDKTEKKNIEDTDFRGMTASTGVGIGRARICTSLDDINDFQEGEVLVASMTRPEFTPAMKKAVAIVTDEGGITSHAAIVSRELGVPCVIGTKVATKTINNGDRIEVKANHGLVRILERAK